MVLSFDELYDLFLAGKAKEYLDSRTTKELKILANNAYVSSSGKRETLIKQLCIRLRERQMLFVCVRKSIHLSN